MIRLVAVAAACGAALVAGACESPAAYEMRPSYATGPQPAAPAANAQNESADHKYVYRGGRDPKTGRAYIQM
jgi:hypothetical protein